MDGRSGNVHFARILCVRESHCHKDIFDIDMSRVILFFRSTRVLSR